MTEEMKRETIALIGLGTIGISFAALHLRYSNANVRLFDVRSDLKEHIESILPVYLDSTKKETKNEDLSVKQLLSDGRIVVCSSIEEVVSNATIVQEQGPDSVDFKKSTWAEVIKYAPSTAHLWSSTSGIQASKQVEDLEDKTRVLVVHPFNPVSKQIPHSSQHFTNSFKASYNASDRNCSFSPYISRENRLRSQLLQDSQLRPSPGKNQQRNSRFRRQSSSICFIPRSMPLSLRRRCVSARPGHHC